MLIARFLMFLLFLECHANAPANLVLYILPPTKQHRFFEKRHLLTDVKFFTFVMVSHQPVFGISVAPDSPI